jgi:SAM-dependent methyltransferase
MRIESLPPEAIPEDTSVFWTALVEKLGPKELSKRFYRTNAERRRLKTLFHLIGKCTPLTTCLEIGCGAGFITAELAQAFEKVWAMDSCKKLIDAAPKIPNVIYHLRDVDTLDWPTCTPYVAIKQSWRVAFLSEILEHVREPSALVANCAKIADYIVASSPIGEQLSPKAFDLAAYDKEPETLEAGSGHIWAWDLEGFASLFDGLEILRIGMIARFGIALVKCEAG